MLRSSIIIVHLALLAVTISCEKFKVIREWNYVNFTWPNDNEYKNALSTETYVKENNIIAGLKYFDDYFYVTLPRMKRGVPATLSRFSASSSEDPSPLLTPFPSWEMNTIGDCQALQNVQNIEIDPEGKIWIIDNGITETLSRTPTARCPPKLVIFDIKANSTSVLYTFPGEVASNATNFLYDIVIDNTDGGYAYITDNSARDPGIVVFSLKNMNSWKIRHARTMTADSTASAFKVNDVVISAPINVASIALGPRIYVHEDRVVVDEDRKVFYSPISSLHVYSLNSSVLKNENNGVGQYQGEVEDFGLKSSQSVGMGMDNRGTLYFSLLASSSIAKWNTRDSFLSGQKIIAKDPRYLEWPNSFAFDTSGNLIVLVNRLNQFIFHDIMANQTNVWLIMSNVGSKGYQYDETVEYKNHEDSSVKNNTTEKQPEPEILPGSPQDAFLVPQPIPKKNAAEVTPTTSSKPESSEPTTMEEDHTEELAQHEDHVMHLHPTTGHETRTANVTDSEQANKSDNPTMHNSTKDDVHTMNDNNTEAHSGSSRLVIYFISFLFASCLFAV